MRYIGFGAPAAYDALVDELLQLRVQAEAAVPLGEVHPGQALVELRAEELVAAVVDVGGCSLEQLVDQVADPLLVGASAPSGCR